MRLTESALLLIASIPAAIVVALFAQTPSNSPRSLMASSKVTNNKRVVLKTIGITNIPLPSPTSTPTTIPPTSAPRPTAIPIAPASESQQDWGVAQKVGEHTYTIKIGYDGSMSNGQEIMQALNTYRQTHGKGALSWDQRLADYAQNRANLFKSIGTTDAHAGFENFLNNEDGFSKLGFNRLGENSYWGGQLSGTHLIEWVFAKSPGHDANQLDSWSHVGIGVNETAVNLNFGAN